MKTDHIERLNVAAANFAAIIGETITTMEEQTRVLNALRSTVVAVEGGDTFASAEAAARAAYGDPFDPSLKPVGRLVPRDPGDVEKALTEDLSERLIPPEAAEAA